MAPETKAKVETDPNASKVNKDNPAQTPQSDLDKAAKDQRKAQEPDYKVQLVEPIPEPAEAEETTEVDRDFVFAHNLDPARQIPGTNKYADVEQRKQAEIERAAVEGREPDLENPPATQGTPYKSADQLRGELPPHAGVKADATFKTVVTKSDADVLEEQAKKDSILGEVTVFNDPAQAQDRESNAEKSKSK